MVEITPKAERQVDAQLTRRLIQLEISDVELPPRPGEPRTGTVFFRVLAPQPDRLHVELWDRGEFYGARRVSITGSVQLRARRIALGAAELARRLRQRRLTDARHRQEETQRKAEERARDAREKRPDGVVLSAGARGAVVGPGGAWIAGPRLQGAWYYPGGTRMGLGLSSLFGKAGSPSLRWLELELAPAQSFRVAPTADLALGVSVGAAAVHVNGVPSVDDVSGQADTWSARAGAFALLEAKLGSGVFLSAGPEAGAVLRRIPYVDAEGERQRLGGLWLGARAAIVIDPN